MGFEMTTVAVLESPSERKPGTYNHNSQGPQPSTQASETPLHHGCPAIPTRLQTRSHSSKAFGV